MWGMGPAVSEEERLDRTETARVLRRAAAMAGPQRRPAAAAMVFVVMSTLATLAGPLLVRSGIDDGVLERDRGPLLVAVAAYCVVLVIAFVGARQQYIFINRAGEGFLRHLRVTLFGHLQRQSIGFYDRNKAGVLVARMTADIESMAELVQWGLLQFVSATILLVLSFGVLAVIAWQLTLVALVVFPVIIIASVRFQRASNTAYLEVRERVGQNLSSLQEGITGVRVIQAYGRVPEQRRRFRAANRALFDSHMNSVRVSTWYFGLVEFCGVFATALVIAVGGWLVVGDVLTVGTVIAVVLLLSNMFEPVQQLSQLYNTVQSSAAALNKIFQILDTTPEVDEHADAVELPAAGVLQMSEVDFTYPGAARPAVGAISIAVEPGQRLALVGPTGAGKSTVAKLMARLYDPDRGAVVFGDVDLRDATTASLRRRIVVVPQEGFLFGGTLADNIRMARPGASDAEIVAALESLGIAGLIDALPDGLATEVRERGSRLSAGERQLVSLARAALVDPAVLVLDEATSSLDPGTESVVEHALDALMAGRTVIVVAHRLSTVRRADQIAVIDLVDGVGRVVELGDHRSLVALGGRYAALAAAWDRAQYALG